MKKKRLLSGITSVFMLLSVLFAPIQTNAMEANKSADNIQLSLAGSQQTPLYMYGEKKELKLVLRNDTEEAITGVTVVPNMEADTDGWPFEIENKDYKINIGNVEAGQSVPISYQLQARSDVRTQYYKLGFTIFYNIGQDQASLLKSIYIKTKEKPVESNSIPDSQGSEEGNKQEYASESTGIINSDVVSSNGEMANASVPRVIVTGFTTDPGEVMAGSDFRLVLKVKNTSTSTAVKNMTIGFTAPTEGKDENTAPAFLPSSGANTLYVDQIPSGAEKDVAIDLNAKQDLIQKPYGLELSMKYEDSSNTQYESSSSVTIPIKQVARFEFSDIQVNPDSVAVEEEANVTGNMYNLGKVKLYNVKVKLEGKSVSSTESFIGNVESGATANIDLMVKGEKETKSPEKVKLIMSYEDADGKVQTAQKEFTISVTPAVEEMPVMEDTEATKKGFPILPVVGGVILIAIIGILVYNKKRRAKNEFDDEMDGPIEDE